MAGTAFTLNPAHPGQRSAISPLLTELRNVVTDLETLRGVVQANQLVANELRTDHEDFRDFLNYKFERDYLIGDPAMVQGSTTDRVSFSAFEYVIGGEVYSTAAQANISPGTSTINTGAAASTLWGAVYFTIDRNGAISTTTMDDSSTDMVAVSEFAGIERLSAHANNALPANEVLVAILSVQGAASQTVTFDTTVLNTSATEIDAITFYSMRGPDARAEIIVGSAAESKVVTAHSSLTGVTSAATYNIAGAAVVKVNGRRDASAASATQTFTVADVINSDSSGDEYGGWLVLKGIDGGDTKFTLAQDGVPEATANMASASSAAVQTLLDALVISPLTVKVGQIIVRGNAAIFTANTTNTDATNITFTGTAQAASTAYQEGATGAVRGIVAPTIPATVGASAPSTTAVDAAGDLIASNLTLS